MKTKLEVGKEYWLGEAKKYKGIYKGNFGNAHYFEPTTWIPTYRDEREHVPFIKDANGFIEFPLRGVFEVDQWQFTIPIAMKCTEEQFNGIKDELVEMGYKLSISRDLIDGIWLVNNFGGVSNCFGLACGTPFQKTKFNSFNPDLFLALAAMTDKEDGIKGEWWKYTDDMNDPIVPQKRLGEFVVPNKAWRKATAQEIIEHFEKKDKKEADRIFELVLDFRSSLFNKINEDKTIIPIPPTKQATIFDDRVEITDWQPKEGDVCHDIYINQIGEIMYSKVGYVYNKMYYKLKSGFLVRTESEAKSLVEKLKQAML